MADSVKRIEATGRGGWPRSPLGFEDQITLDEYAALHDGGVHEVATTLADHLIALGVAKEVTEHGRN